MLDHEDRDSEADTISTVGASEADEDVKSAQHKNRPFCCCLGADKKHSPVSMTLVHLVRTLPFQGGIQVGVENSR